MTTEACCAVSRGGRVNSNTLVMEAEHRADLQRLTDAVHAEGALIAAQPGPAGYVANTRVPTMGPSTRLSAPARAWSAPLPVSSWSRW